MLKLLKSVTHLGQLLLVVVLMLPLSAGAVINENVWMKSSPQRCAPINPEWASDIWAAPNGVVNIGSQAIWVVCSFDVQYFVDTVQGYFTALNLADVPQDITCGFREYSFLGSTISAELATVEVPADGAWQQWTFAEVDATTVSMFAIACKLEPKMVLKSIWITPFET